MKRKKNERRPREDNGICKIVGKLQNDAAIVSAFTDPISRESLRSYSVVVSRLSRNFLARGDSVINVIETVICVRTFRIAK